jgi:hypothetical protein
MQGLRADVARLALRVVGARLDCLRDGLLVFFVGVILFRVAAAVNPFTNLLVAAAPVVMLASGITVPGLTSNASRRVVGQWGGAGGAICEDHFALGVCARRVRRREEWSGEKQVQADIIDQLTRRGTGTY